MQGKESKREAEIFWNAGVDLKRLTLCLRKELWIAAAAALCGALLAGAVYLAVRRLSMGEPQYRAQALFAIRYDIQEEDETLKAFINEYNAYTWGDVMRSDKVVPAVLEAVPEMSREEAEACLDTSIASDPEFLNVGFTTGSAALSERVRDAYVRAMAAFGETMRDRGLTAIEAWKLTPARPVSVPNRVLYAMELGAVLGLLAGGLFLTGRCVLDDSVLLAEDIRRYYPYPVLGYRTEDPGVFWNAQLDANLARIAEKGDFAEVSLEEIMTPGADFAGLRAVPAALRVPWGTPCLRRLGPALETLEIQEVKVCGFIVMGADSRFLDRYYGMRGKRRTAGNGGDGS